MDCPWSKRPMTAGTIVSHGTRGDGAFFVGPHGDKNPIDKYTRKDALQCDDCGTILIRRRFTDDG